MSSIPFHLDRQRGLRSILGAAWVGLGLGLLAAGSVAAQAPMPSSRSAPMAPGVATTTMQSPPSASASAVERAYDEMDWTGRPAAPAILRKEARAALVAGRRHCTTLRAASERQDCLRVVQEDYQEMLSSLQSRTARR